MPVPFRPQVLVVEDTRMGRQALNAGLVAGYRLRRTRANAPILLYAKSVPKPWPFAPSAFGSMPTSIRRPRRRSSARLFDASCRLGAARPPWPPICGAASTIGLSPGFFPAYAQQVRVGERQLRRDFLTAYGLTPRKYGVWVRLRQAAWLLRATRLRAGQVVRQDGFASPTALGRAFRHESGTMPRAFRAAPFPDPPPPGDPGPGLDRPTAEG